MPPQKFNFNFAPAEEEDFDEEEDIEEEMYGHPMLMRKATPEELEKIEKKQLAEYPAKTQKVIGVLKNLQQKYSDLEKQFEEEYLKLREKYAALYAPVIIRRNEIVTGEVEATSEELSTVALSEVTTEKTEDLKGVPDFWYKVLLHSEIKAELIQEDDLEALKFLKNVVMEEFPAKPKEESAEKKEEEEEEEIDYKHNPGFRIIFQFNENPFFTNTQLVKSYYYEEADSEDIATSEGTEITWAEGKDLTVKVTTKKQKHKSGNRTRTIQVKEPKDSFFNFFKNLDEEIQKEENEENMILQELLEADAEIGDILKERIIPNAVDYFLNVALPKEGDFSTVPEVADMLTQIQAGLTQPQGEGGEQPAAGQQECKQQ
ncbi:predicted protein [Naegleria gruberi]|uniref:Predicted protein n=1 Tax=Naegleria gruberi TaxID=5762 RepID=D2W0R2_NAEGR|nr:uncharacterized protein NAEGRDRAFT_81952 [Naegleria gruberi]EFC37379.1 predicted protein [Naegleria gruberi]|eukprot:XP_002670123.1 predicted protein [Naegleria gruberi strain NEG-M]